MPTQDATARAQDLIAAYLDARRTAEGLNSRPANRSHGSDHDGWHKFHTFSCVLMSITQPRWHWNRSPFAELWQLARAEHSLTDEQLAGLAELHRACNDVLEAEPSTRVACVYLLLPVMLTKSEALSGLGVTNGEQRFAHGEAESEILSRLLRDFPPVLGTDIRFILRTWRESWEAGHARWVVPVDEILDCVQRYVKRTGMDQDVRTELTVFRDTMLSKATIGSVPEFVATFDDLLGIPIDVGDAWGKDVREWFIALEDAERTTWRALLKHAKTATAARPSAVWLANAQSRMDAVGGPWLNQTLLRLLSLLVELPRQSVLADVTDSRFRPVFTPLRENNTTLVRGLVWCCSLLDDAETSATLARICAPSYANLKGQSVKIGNGCIWSLGAMTGMHGIVQLQRIAGRVRDRRAQRLIDEALTAAAARARLTRDDLDEQMVPDHGLVDGRLRSELGGFKVEIAAAGPSLVETRWYKADGAPLKAAPAAVKRDYKHELKEFKRAADGIAASLLVQRDRLDGLHLAQRSWTFVSWRERYRDHPLVSILARRLIWSFGEGDAARSGVWFDGRFVGADDRPLATPDDDTNVRLWHPIDATANDVLAWREWLERHEVRQPFKQAHREVYLLTDAERRTGVYSNRFAAHIIRQHQFNSLCAARGWRNTLRLMVDDSYPPASRALAQWGLRAEFWVEGAGQTYGVDTSDAGTYLRLATDQVRFYRIGDAQRHAHATGGGYAPERGQTDEPAPLEEIPPLVFSEIMRDVDLFVGVASVGNDPTWQDGGPNGAYRDYWQDYAFGDLSMSSQTRRAVLERLAPRLKIADRCRFTDRFIVVRGDLRTYKIHLGSGNILMEPNDQYLCIVPGQSLCEDAQPSAGFLPFDGDRVLTIILSKAFLLANDRAITDPTITSQIASR